MSESEEKYLKGRGAQVNTHNPYQKTKVVQEHWEAIDEERSTTEKTQYLPVYPKSILNEVESPDVGFGYSLNTYQGCEHGCTYCYARNTHQYWGYSAGTDFERIILVKEDAPRLLEEAFRKPKYQVKPIMFSGNTDCYQPVEKHLQITRKCLEVIAKYKHPVSLITKNSLIMRDLDLLQELQKNNLVSVAISLNSLNEDLRRLLEPRTASVVRRLETIKTLSGAGIPVMVMIAPVIPGLNSEEILKIASTVAEAGARNIGHTIVRLNGSIGEIFRDWLQKNYPGRAAKVIHQIENCHGGNINDAVWGRRMHGEGAIAKEISDMIRIARKKYFTGREMPALNYDAFVRIPRNGQLSVFG